MNETNETDLSIAMPPMRRKPRPHETICVGGRTKWRLDALCLLGRRSRTATLDILIDEFLKGKPTLRAQVEERSNDPHPIQLKKRPGGVPGPDGE